MGSDRRYTARVRNALRAQLGVASRRRMWILAALMAGLSVVPLAGTLGYEHAFVLCPVLSLFGVAVGVDAVARARRAAVASASAMVRDAVVDLGRLLGVGFAVAVVALLWQTNCDPWTGAAFFVMGPVASATAGMTAGLWAGVVARRRGRQLGLGLAVVVASTAIGAWRLISDPVVFAFDPFWGYFSGAIYDEDVSIGSTYLVFRAYNAIAVVAALQALVLTTEPGRLTLRRPDTLLPQLRGRITAASAAFAGLVAALAIGLTGPSWGFTANVDTITTVLSGARETEHFVIHYSPRSADARSIDAIAIEHEFAWSQLRDKMDGREPSEKVHSFVFTSPGQKRTLMGAGTVQVAAPWRGQIYLDHRAFPHPVLHHELAHVFGKTIGDDLFGVARSGAHLNIALIEGFATAMAPRSADHLDLHDQALVLERLKRRPSLASIMGPSFFTQSSRVAYTAAGSFCLWLIETRGFSPMATLYRTAGDFEAAYGTPLATLETEWLAFLETRGGVTEDDVESQRQRFMRRSVFRRPCAHRAANLAGEIRRSNRQGRHADAVALYQTLCTIEPDDPGHLIGLSSAQAIDGDFAAALASLDVAAAMDDLTVTLKAALLSRRAEVALAAGDLEQAAAAEHEALQLPIRRSARRTHQLRLAAAEDPRLAARIVEYLAPFSTEGSTKAGTVRRLLAAMQIRELPQYQALGAYLLARQLLNTQLADAATPLLQQALDPAVGDRGLPSPEFRRAAVLALLSASVQAGHFDTARDALRRLSRLTDSGHGDDAVLQLWRARVEFFAANAEPRQP